MSAFSDLIIADGAVAYWRLGELGNPLVDIAGGHNGTGSNVTFGQDGIDSDKSILTDGASGRVTTGWSLTLPASFTIEAWVKIPAGTPGPVLGNRPIISNYAASGTMTVNINGNDVILSFSGATPVSSSATVGTIPDNQWHQIVVKSSATSTIFLFDGVLKQTNGHSKPAASAGTVFIGYDFAADLFFQGGLDEIAIFPTSLLTSKILAHYNAATAAQTAVGSGRQPMMTRNSTTTGVRPKAPTRLSVGTAAVQGSNTPCHGVIVKAMSPSQTIYVGASSAVTAADGYPLADSGTLTLEVTNTNQLWFIASAASQAVSLFPYTWL